MRQRLVTENVIDIAVDINESLRVVDGIIPMEVETLEETPEIEEAEVGKYYAEEDYVLTPDLEKDEWIKSYPICISYDGHLYIIKNEVWSKIAENNEAYDGHLASTSNPHNVTALQVGAYSKSENDNLLDKKANLDLNNKIPLSEIPDSILGQLKYMGVWNFSSGLPAGAEKGNYWIASVSGNGYEVGDWAVYNGTSFDKVDNTDAVSSVAGRTGNVVLNKNDVGLSNVDNTSDLNKPISTATQTALNTTVKLTGNQTIAGVKTFSSSPIVPVPTTNTQAANKAYVDDRLKLLSTDYYQDPYGLEWNETTDTYRRIGSQNYTAIQSLMRRCVLNADGSVKYYLDPNNSNYKEDGTLAVLDGTDGNVMVEVPKTYVRYGYTTTGGAGTDTVHRWEISLEPENGFEAHWAFDRGGVIRDKRYYPAYLGYVTGGKMISRSGVYPTVDKTLAQFRTAAKANSISNPSSGQTVNGYWGNIDFALYELITLFAVIEYGTMNIQSALGRGRTALSGGAWVGGDLIGVNGLSNEYGNRTANYTYVGASRNANADLSFMSYRGCENFFGNVWRMADGVIFKGTTPNKTMWYSTNPTEYNEDGTGYTNSGIVTAAAVGYGRKLANTNKGFIVSDVTGGSSNAGTTDLYYTSSTDNTLALVGSASDNGLSAGPLALYVYDSAASLSTAAVGCGVSF